MDASVTNHREMFTAPDTKSDNEIEKMYGTNPSLTAMEKFNKIQTLIGFGKNGGWHEYANQFWNEHITICLGNTKSGKSTIVQTKIGAKLVGKMN